MTDASLPLTQRMAADKITQLQDDVLARSRSLLTPLDAAREEAATDELGRHQRFAGRVQAMALSGEARWRGEGKRGDTSHL